MKKEDFPVNDMEDEHEVLMKELKNEAKEYLKVKPKRHYGGMMSSTHSEDEKEESYVISKKWLKAWKVYVGYNEVKRNNDRVAKSTAKVDPGPITNEDILEPKEKFYHSTEEEDPYNIVLKHEKREHVDYNIINRKQWNILYSKYQGTPIKREKQKNGYYYYTFTIEVYFQEIQLVILDEMNENFSYKNFSSPKSIYISKKKTMLDFKARIMNVLNSETYGYQLNQNNFRLWKLDPLFNSSKLQNFIQKNEKTLQNYINSLIKSGEDASMDDDKQDDNIEKNSGVEFPGLQLDIYKSKSLEKCMIAFNDLVIVERANSKGEFLFKYIKNMKIGKCEYCYHEKPLAVCCKCEEAFYCTESCRKKDERFHSDKCTAMDLSDEETQKARTQNSNMGLTGLQNLGNTCFMNSGIQCLSNTYELTRYFLEDYFRSEINKDNPLGTGGKMALSYHKLIRDLWYDSYSSISPWNLKRIIAKFQPMFSGYSQHDSQELISYILDGLHEDLNRVKKKPYIENQDYDDPDVNMQSLECWNNHLKRNQSIIADLMHGQFKSTVHCPKCLRFSVTFDPFNTIPLPIPVNYSFVQKFYFVYYDLKQVPKKCAVIANKNEKVKDFRMKVAEMLKIEPNSFLISFVSNDEIDRLVCSRRRMKIFDKLSSSILFLMEINPNYYNGPDNIGMEAKMKTEEDLLKEKAEAEKKKKEEEMKNKNSDYEEDKYDRYSNNANYRRHNAYGNARMEFQSSEEDDADNDDYNNGLDDEILRVVTSLSRKEKKYSYYNFTRKERKSFPRILWFKRSMTLKQIHFEVFSYLRPYFNIYFKEKDKVESISHSDFEKLSDEDAFKILYEGLTEDNWKKKFEKSNFPYILTIVNHNTDNFHKEKCFYCGSKECENCPLPFTSQQTLRDFLQKIKPSKPENHHSMHASSKQTSETTPTQITNSYYYYQHRYYYDKNKDFELEVLWNESDKHVKCGLKFNVCDEHSELKANSSYKDKAVSLYDCFDLFIKPERLGEQNTWYCNKCKDHMKATKKMEIFRSPPILIIQLKRFKSQSNYGVSSGRLSYQVDCPLENLDLTSYIQYQQTIPIQNSKKSKSKQGEEEAKSEEGGSESNIGVTEKPIYDLYAISNHYGSMGFGHYTAFGKHVEDGVWYRFDDSHVSKVASSEVVSSASYVLFYKRKDLVDKKVDFKRYKQVPVDDEIMASMMAKAQHEHNAKMGKESGGKVMVESPSKAETNEKLNNGEELGEKEKCNEMEGNVGNSRNHEGAEVDMEVDECDAADIQPRNIVPEVAMEDLVAQENFNPNNIED